MRDDDAAGRVAEIEGTPVGAPHRCWYDGPHRRWLLKNGYLGPKYVEVRVTKGQAWWALDNVVLGVVANLRHGPGSGTAWRLVPSGQALEMTGCLADLGYAGRLEVRRMPTREELER